MNDDRIVHGNPSSSADELHVLDVKGWAPTTYADYSPTMTNDDARTLVETLYRTDFTRDVTTADGLPH